MGPAKETAEEQLLRMIEGPARPAPSLGRPGGWQASFDRLLGQLRGWSGEFRRRVVPSPQRQVVADPLLWRLRLAERLIWIVLVGLALYLVADLWLVPPKRPPVAARQAQPSSTSATESVEPLTQESLRPLAEYRDTLVSRNPFGIASQRTGERSVGGESVASRLAELTGPLQVVGISRGRISEALVEDTAAQRTFVVKVGDQINQLTVKAINQNGVVVSYEGEETLLQ